MKKRYLGTLEAPGNYKRSSYVSSGFLYDPRDKVAKFEYYFDSDYGIIGDSNEISLDRLQKGREKFSGWYQEKQEPSQVYSYRDDQPAIETHTPTDEEIFNQYVATQLYPDRFQDLDKYDQRAIKEIWNAHRDFFLKPKEEITTESYIEMQESLDNIRSVSTPTPMRSPTKKPNLSTSMVRDSAITGAITGVLIGLALGALFAGPIGIAIGAALGIGAVLGLVFGAVMGAGIGYGVKKLETPSREPKTQERMLHTADTDTPEPSPTVNKTPQETQPILLNPQFTAFQETHLTPNKPSNEDTVDKREKPRTKPGD